MKPLVKYSYSYQWGLLDDNGDVLAKNEQVYLASDVDPRLAALVEALKAVLLFGSKISTQIDGGMGMPRQESKESWSFPYHFIKDIEDALAAEKEK